MNRKRILLFCPDSNVTMALEEKLAAVEWAELTVEPAYPTPGQVGRLVHERRPAMILISLAEVDYALGLIEEISRTYPGILVAATHGVNQPELILSAVRAGAAEYLGPPYEAQHLERVLEERQDLHLPDLKAKGRLVAFLPAGGGSGASTTALHVAGAMSRRGGKKLLLVDWDFHCGAAAFRLRLKPGFGLADALERAGEMDEFWGKLACSWKGIDVLPPGSPERLMNEDMGRLPALLASARRSYDWILCDLPPAVQGCELMLNEAETVCLVCTPDVVALHLARRRLDELRRQGIPDGNLRLVVNRAGDASFSPDEIRKLVGIPVAWSLPSDYRVVQSAALEGRLVAEGCELGRGYQRIARELAEPLEPAPKQPKQLPSAWRPIPKFLEVPSL